MDGNRHAQGPSVSHKQTDNIGGTTGRTEPSQQQQGLMTRLLHSIGQHVGGSAHVTRHDSKPRQDAMLPVGVERGDDEDVLERKEDVLNALPEKYFEEDVDAMEFELQEMGYDVSSGQLERVAEERSAVLDVIGEKLSCHILNEYDSFQKGVEDVSVIEERVEVAKLHAKVSRERLASAAAQVQKGIAVWKNAQRKKSLSLTLEILGKLQHSLKLLDGAEEDVQGENYGSAVEKCTSCAETVSCLFDMGIDAAYIVSERANELLCQIADQMQDTLAAMTTQFDAIRYTKLMNGYEFLTDPERVLGAGEVQPTQEILTTYCAAPSTKVKRVVNGVLYSKVDGRLLERVSEQSNMMDLLSLVPADAFKLCIGQILRVEFDIIKSYYDLEQWHQMQDSRGGLSTRTKPMFDEISESLQQGRRMLWNEASRALSAALQGAKLSEGETFLIVSKWINTFAEIGFMFSGESPEALQSVLSHQTLRFFQGYHANSLEAMHLMLDKETFKVVPVQIPWMSIDVEDIKNNISEQETSIHRKDAPSLERYMRKENPWNDSTQDVAIDFLGDVKKRLRELHVTIGDGDVLVTTNAAWRVIKWIMEYVSLMKDLPTASSTIFTGLHEIVDLFFLHAYVNFVSNTLYEDDGSLDVSPNLHASMKHAVQVSLAKHTALFISSIPSSPVSRILGAGVKRAVDPSVSRSGSLVRGISLQRTPPTSLSNSGNLYGFRERIITCDVITTISDFLTQIRPIICSYIPDSEGEVVSSSIKRMSRSAHDLKSAIFSHGCALLLPVTWLTEAVSQAEYQLSEPPSEAAVWTKKLEKQLQLLSAQLLAVDGISQTVLWEFWEYFYPIIAHSIVEGLSQVKKCTLEGRSAMSLDLQAVTRILQITSPKVGDHAAAPTPGAQSRAMNAIRYIDDYIKAFYVPTTEIHQWAATHPGYTKSQVLALAACIAESSGLRKKDVTSIVAEVEENLSRASLT